MGGDSYIHCQAPQLFTTKSDNTLGYCIINIQGDEVTDIKYRQWSNKRYRFNPGADFTEDESGIVRFVENEENEHDIGSAISPVEDKILILLQAKLNNKM